MMNLLLMRQIIQIQLQILRYEQPVVYFLGNLGNVANILIFGRHELRKNVCSWYFICLSVVHLLLLNTFCLSLIIVNSTGNNVFQYIMSLCKIRAYFFELSLLLSRYFLCLISIDRWMVTSPKASIRQHSSTRVSRWLIIIGIIFCTIFSSHAAIGYQTGPIDCTPPFGSSYELFFSIESIITSMTPMLIMSVFSFLTILNVRLRMNRQIYPTTTNNSHPTQQTRTIMLNAQSSRQIFKRNIQLVRLSILQVILYLFLNSVWSIIPVYSFSVGPQAMMTINQQMILLIIGRIGLNFLFTYAAVSFFVFLN